MAIVTITLQSCYVTSLVKVLTACKEIPIERITVVHESDKQSPEAKQRKKLALMRIAGECASLPDLTQLSPDQILGYDQSLLET